MRRTKFSLRKHVQLLNLKHELLNVLEEKRPLTHGSLLLANQQISLLSDLQNRMRLLPNDALKLAFACETLGASEIFDKWTSSVLVGSSQMVYTGRANAQKVFLILCMAAGSSLRRPASEPFRLILSYLTKLGIKPEQMDEGPYVLKECSAMEMSFYDRMTTYLSLKSHVKGAEIVAALCAGLASFVSMGTMRLDAARDIFYNVEGYRSSSPLLQLVSAT